MPTRTLPNIGLLSEQDDGSSGWGGDYRGNHRAFDALIQMAVENVLNAPPANPIEGQRHLIGSAPTGPWAGRTNTLAAWYDGAWRYFVPREGWTLYNRDPAVDDLFVYRNDAWVRLRATAAMMEAGTDDFAWATSAGVRAGIRSAVEAGFVDVRDYGLRTGIANAAANVAAFNANYAAMRAKGVPIRWTATNSESYWFNAPLVVDQSVNFDLGMSWIGGGGWRRSTIRFTGLSAGQVAMRFQASHAVPPAMLSDWYGLNLFNLCIASDHNGCLVAFGKDDFSDPVNALYAENCVFLNSGVGSLTEAVRLNGCYNTVFVNTYANCFADGLGTNYGKALRVRQGGFFEAVGGAYGNADVGVSFEDGFAYAFKFSGCTFENTRIGIYNGSANSGGHSFTNCAYSLHNDWAFQAPVGYGDVRFRITGGNCNPPSKLLDPANCVGIDANGIRHEPTYPAFPAGGVTVRNTTGRTLSVKLIGGTFNSFTINGYTYPNSFRDYILNPGDEYSIDTPAGGIGWVVRQIR